MQKLVRLCCGQQVTQQPKTGWNVSAPVDEVVLGKGVVEFVFGWEVARSGAFQVQEKPESQPMTSLAGCLGRRKGATGE